MSGKLLHAVCPVCSTAFVLKGARLRIWIKAKEQKPTRKGPYCSYHCSSRANVQCTPTYRKSVALLQTLR